MILCPLCGTIPDRPSEGSVYDDSFCDCELVLARLPPAGTPDVRGRGEFTLGLWLRPAVSSLLSDRDGTVASILDHLHLSAFRDGRVEADDGSVEDLPDPGARFADFAAHLAVRRVLGS